MPFRTRRMMAPMLALGALSALAGCKSTGELVVQDGVGITAVRSTCPAVGLADYTGDITLFKTPGTTDSRAIDIVAAITDVRQKCDPKSTPVDSQVSFKVIARRSDTHGERTVTLPYFVTVVRGTNVVIAKRLGTATLHFADGQTRAEAIGTGSATIDKSEATLNRDVRSRLLRDRKAGEADAAIDPLTDPEVRAAVSRATFEVLVGFQLTPEQLAYNGTR
jgi:hypothetical protein